MPTEPGKFCWVVEQNIGHQANPWISIRQADYKALEPVNVRA
jgi:hypothetical protein